MTNEEIKNLGYKATQLKQEYSTKYAGMTLLDEQIIDTITAGNTIYRTSQILGVAYRTVKKRIATNFELRQHIAGDIELSADYVAEQLLDELHRIAMNAKSDGIKVKAIVEYLKVLGRTKDVVSLDLGLKTPIAGTDVEELLKTLGV